MDEFMKMRADNATLAKQEKKRKQAEKAAKKLVRSSDNTRAASSRMAPLPASRGRGIPRGRGGGLIRRGAY